LSINSNTGVISGTVSYTSAERFGGDYDVTVIVVNDHGGSATVSFDWTIDNVTRAPVLTQPSSQSDVEGDTVSLQIEADQPDDNWLYFEAEGLPDGLTIDPFTGLITGTLAPWAASDTAYSVTVTVSVVAWSPDHATLLTEGLLFLEKRETFGQIPWRGQETTPQQTPFWDSHLQCHGHGHRLLHRYSPERRRNLHLDGHGRDADHHDGTA
jgi:hypothetical protein